MVDPVGSSPARPSTTVGKRKAEPVSPEITVPASIRQTTQNLPITATFPEGLPVELWVIFGDSGRRVSLEYTVDKGIVTGKGTIIITDEDIKLVSGLNPPEIRIRLLEMKSDAPDRSYLSRKFLAEKTVGVIFMEADQ